MRVVVTGADGFVGRHLTVHLRAAGDEVLPLAGPHGDAEVGLRIDILDGDALRAAIVPFRPDAFVNLAGASSVSESHTRPLPTFRVNVMGVACVCTTLRDFAPKVRLLHVGSAEMYGPVPPGLRALESDPLLPNSPYAASKVSGEATALAFHRGYGLDVIAARPFNHLGRGQSPSFAVPTFARQLEQIRTGHREPSLAVGNLTPVRDFLHVGDVVAAYRILLERGVAGQAYNICSGEGRTVRSLVDELIALSGVPASIEVDAARVRQVELPYLVGDPARMATLGWTPRLTVRSALSDALAEASALE